MIAFRVLSCRLRIVPLFLLLRTFGHPPVHLTVLISLASLAGCSYWEEPVQVTTEIHSPVLLLSEVLSASDRTKLVDCPIEFVNSGSKPAEVKLLRTGCSCYGVTIDGHPLEKGETITIPQGGSQIARIRVQPPTSNAEKYYTADFSTQARNGNVRPISTRCHVRVYSDIRLIPSVVVVDAHPGEATSGQYAFLIENVYRGNSENAPVPRLTDLPECMTTMSLTKYSDPERLQEGLWRQTWEAIVRVDVPAERPESQPPMKFTVSVYRGDTKLPGKGDGSLLVHTRRRVTYPYRIHMGCIPLGSKRTRRLLITTGDDTYLHLNINTAELPPYMTLELEEHLDGRYWLELSATPEKPGRFSEVIRLITDSYDFAEINIQVEGLVEATSTHSNMPDEELEGEVIELMTNDIIP